MIDVTAIRQRYLALSPHLDERARRIFAATEAHTAGYGGIAAVSRATGIAASTIGRGLAELAVAAPLVPERVRRPGGGDKKLVQKDPTLLADLMAMVEPDARGDPMSPLRWTCKSLSQLAGVLVPVSIRSFLPSSAPQRPGRGSYPTAAWSADRRQTDEPGGLAATTVASFCGSGRGVDGWLRRHGGLGRRCVIYLGCGADLQTVIRHATEVGAISTATFSVQLASAVACLISATCLALIAPPRVERTLSAAVSLASVASSTKNHLAAATRAK